MSSCVILRPDPQTLFNQFRDNFASTVLGGGKVIPESNEWYVVSNDYAAAEQFYAIADQMWREANPETACCDNLYKMAAQRGVYPRPAQSAQGYATLTGVPGSAIPGYFEIETSAGIFTSVGSLPLATMPSSGSLIVRIQALEPGAQGNANPGEVTTGTLITAAPGIDGTVTICGGQFCNGAAAEECEAFRKRYLERLAYQPRATMAWIKEKLLEWPCATRVCVREGECCRCEPDCECVDCQCKNCGNRLEFYVLFDGVFDCGIPPQDIADSITTWMFGEHQGYGEGQVEVGVCGKIFVPRPLPVDVFIDIVGCPSIAQKQEIANQVCVLFQRICPSLPFRIKQVELIVSQILGAEVNVGVRFEPPNGVTWSRDDVFVSVCGDLEPTCDVLPCLGQISFTGPDQRPAPC